MSKDYEFEVLDYGKTAQQDDFPVLERPYLLTDELEYDQNSGEFEGGMDYEQFLDIEGWDLYIEEISDGSSFSLTTDELDQLGQEATCF